MDQRVPKGRRAPKGERERTHLLLKDSYPGSLSTKIEDRIKTRRETRKRKAITEPAWE